VQLSLTESERSLRDEVREFLAKHQPDPDDIPEELGARVGFLRVWQRRLSEAGLLALTWPSEYGGRDAPLGHQIVVDQEMARAQAPELVGSIGLSVVGPSIIKFGTREQKATYLKRMLSAEDIWCQGFSEPEAGSDLASLRTRAEDRGDHFILNGHKVWTSFGTFAKWSAVLARTNPEERGNRGISFLIVDLESDGVQTSPLVQTTGDPEFGEMYFEDVIVPRENLLGEADGGWRIAMHTLAQERSTYAMARQVLLRVALDRAISLAKTVPRGSRPAIETPEVLAKLARAHADVEVLKHQCYRSMGRLLGGDDSGFDSSVDKLLLASTEQEVAAAALDVLGAYAASGVGPSGVGANAYWHRFYLYGRAASVYGGSAQIQRNIVAERILGLPKAT